MKSTPEILHFFEMMEDAIAAKVIERLAPILSNKQPLPQQEEIMDVPMLANYLKVATGWIYKKVSSKVIPFFKSGGHLRFRKSEIDKWLESNNGIA